MQDVTIYNICCQAGQAKNNVVESAWQMTDISVLNSVIGKQPGWVMSKNNESLSNESLQNSSNKKISTKRTTLRYIAREIIWKLGKWRDKGLKDFVQNINPDILYLPIYRSGYMCEVQQHVMNLVECPVVCHMSDDVYSYPPKPYLQPLKLSYYAWMRKKIKRLIQKSEYGEVFARKMADEYSSLFNRKFYVIGKGVDTDNIQPNTEWKLDDCVSFVYTGNYGGERGVQLILLAQAIASNFKKGEAELKIYSATKSDEDTDAQLSDTGVVKFCGSVSAEGIRDIQSKADFLVHVEGFSEKSIVYTRMSFSTKLIDYMLAQRPILAIGPEEINSIQILKDNDLAIVANDKNELNSIIKQISKHALDIDVITKRATDYIKANRDIKKIQDGIRHRMSAIVKNEC